MTAVALLGATGNLGSHVARAVIERGWQLSVLVRSPGKLPAEVASRARVSVGDASTMPLDELAGFIAGHDALVSCAGVVTQGEAYVALFDRIVSAAETVRAPGCPVAWFLAGAALLDLDARGRRGIDLPKVRTTFAPHRRNLERLQRTHLDWRLLCPGPMVHPGAIGIERLRISVDVLPAPIPGIARHLPAPLLLPLFAARIPQMIVPYADAAAVMLANLERGGAYSRRRIGIALPAGMRGRKAQWTSAAPAG